MSLQARPLGGVAAACWSEELLSSLPKSLHIPPARCQSLAKLSCTQAARLTSAKHRVPPVPSPLELQLELRWKWRGRWKFPSSGPGALQSSPHRGQTEWMKRFCPSSCLKFAFLFITEGLEYTKCLIRKKKNGRGREKGKKNNKKTERLRAGPRTASRAQEETAQGKQRELLTPPGCCNHRPRLRSDPWFRG